MLSPTPDYRIHEGLTMVIAIVIYGISRDQHSCWHMIDTSYLPMNDLLVKVFVWKKSILGIYFKKMTSVEGGLEVRQIRKLLSKK